MHLESIHAMNFRRFGDVRVTLQPGFNLLIGDNQSGKTSALDAICIGLGTFFLGFRTGNRPSLLSTDVRRSVHLVGGKSEMPAQYPTEVTCQIDFKGSKLIGGYSLGAADSNPIAIGELEHIGRQFDISMQNGEALDLPVFAYFGTERVTRHSRAEPSEKDENISDRSLGYFECLSRESNPALIQWWIWRQTIAEYQQAQRNIPKTAAEPLRGIERAICRCIPEVTQFFYDSEFSELTVVFGDKRRLPWSMLSDGVRSLMMLAMDLSWRACVLNPHLGNEAPERSTGIVLIDEIDLALHPTWQRRITDDLQRAFPQLQFIATTHSPQVIGSSEQARVQLIEGDVVTLVPHPYGKDSNTVLTDVMGASERDDLIMQLFEKVNNYIAGRKWDEARSELSKLGGKIDSLDTEIVRLRARIDFMSRAAERK